MSDGHLPYSCQSISAEDIEAVTEVLRGRWLTTGPAVKSFELALGQAAGGVTAVAVSSGTAALQAAYAAAGLGSGKKLLTSPLTFAATATAALHLGAEVQFSDVIDDTLTLDPAAAEASAEPGVSVLGAVDFAGHPADLDALQSVADKIGAILVEDAAHSLGAFYKGRAVGSIAPLTTFSFHPVKVITTGEGGAVATTSDEYASFVRRFRNHGITNDPDKLTKSEGEWHYEVQSLGYNFRMPDILAALGCSQLLKLSAFVAQRQLLAQRYDALLADVAGLRLPATSAEVQSAWHLYVVRVLDHRRRHLYDHLRSKEINAQVHYLPLTRHPLFVDLGFRIGTCPVAETAYEELLSLPLFPSMTQAQQDRVVEEVRAALGG